VFTRAVVYVWQQELRDAFTPEVSDAWRSLFAYIIGQLNRLTDRFTLSRYCG